MNVQEFKAIEIPELLYRDLPTKINGAVDIRMICTLTTLREAEQERLILEVVPDRQGVAPVTESLSVTPEDIESLDASNIKDIWGAKPLGLESHILLAGWKLMAAIPEVDQKALDRNQIKTDIRAQLKTAILQQYAQQKTAEGKPVEAPAVQTATQSILVGADGFDPSQIRLDRRADRAHGQDTYNIYRPLRFSELYDPTMRAARQLINEMSRLSIRHADQLDDPLVSNPFAPRDHSWVFHGDSGTGKTTMAMIISLAVNCENPQPYGPEGARIDPCMECPSCMDIAENAMSRNHTSVLYYSAANEMGKVDAVRDMTEYELLGPSALDADYTMVIINESHLLTSKAYSSLLVPVENMDNTRYIFLTTTAKDPFEGASKKDRNALSSRFKRIWFAAWPTADIKALLRDLAYQEGRILELQIHDNVLDLIAKRSEGNSRLAIQILSQAMNGLEGTELTLDVFADMMQNISFDYVDDTDSIDDLKRAIYRLDLIGTLKELNRKFRNSNAQARSIADSIYYRVSKALAMRASAAAVQNSDYGTTLQYSKMSSTLEQMYEGGNSSMMNPQAHLQNALAEAILNGTKARDRFTKVA